MSAEKANHSYRSESSALSSTQNSWVGALKDLHTGLKLWRIWLALAQQAIKLQYRRSWLGFGWVFITFSLFASAKIFVFSFMSSQNLNYFTLHLLLGYLIFRLLSSFFNQGAHVFVKAERWIKSEPLPLSVYIYQLLTNSFVIFAICSIPCLIAYMLLAEVSLNALLSFPASLIIYALNGVWVSILAGMLCARFRDLQHLLGSIIQVSYFLTPVLWVPPETGLRSILAFINPFTHFIEILREPLIKGTYPFESWVIVGVITLFGFAITFIIFSMKRKQLIFWI